MLYSRYVLTYHLKRFLQALNVLMTHLRLISHYFGNLSSKKTETSKRPNFL